MNSDSLTIEDCAKAARVTWRTARNRLDAANVRPVKSTKKSVLYERIPALRAVLYPDSRDQEQIDRQLGFIGACVLPTLFSTEAPMLRYLIGLLREKGCAKAEALQEAGTLLILSMETITQHCLPGDLKAEPPDWLAEANEISTETGLNGIELMAEYCRRHWPDHPP